MKTVEEKIYNTIMETFGSPKIVRNASSGPRGRGRPGYPVPDVLKKDPISESKSDKIGVTIGRFQPFTEAHGKMIRELTKAFDKVIVFIAGNKKDSDNPFSYDLRLEIIQKSLPDVISKIELCKAEANGKQSGYIPDLLLSFSRENTSIMNSDTAVTVLVGADRVGDMKRMVVSAQQKSDFDKKTYNPELTIVKSFATVSSGESSEKLSPTQIREALLKKDKAAVFNLIDPHLSSNRAQFEEIYSKMSKEISSKNEIVENLEAVGGVKAIEVIINNNIDVLRKKKGLNLSNMKKLGSGKEGVAFDIGGQQVLKVTTDKLEAISSNVVKEKGKNSPNIVKIFDVFRFAKTPGTSEPIYGIVQEKLVPLDEKDAYQFDILASIFTDDSMIKTAYNGNFDQILAACKEVISSRVYKRRGLTYTPKAGVLQSKNDVKTTPDVNASTALATKSSPNSARTVKRDAVDQHAKTDLAMKSNPNSAVKTRPAKPDAFHKQSDISLEREIDQDFARTEKLLKHYEIDKIIPQLRKLGIGFADFHSGNMMKRGTQYVINDLGRSRSGGTEPPMLERVVSLVLKELDSPTPGNFSGLGGSQTGLRGGSSSWSAPIDCNDEDEEEEPLWQNQLRALQPIDRRSPDEIPKSLRR